MLHIRGRSVGFLKDNVLDGRNSGIVSSCASRSRKRDANLYALSKGRVSAAPLHRGYSMLNAFSFKQFNIVQSRCGICEASEPQEIKLY
jgi:hypothetical protein